MFLLTFILKLGVPWLNLTMFIRKKKNKSGSQSVQIISKARGKYKVITTIGSGKTEQELQRLLYIAQEELERLTAQSKCRMTNKQSSTELYGVFFRVSHWRKQEWSKKNPFQSV
ncbi:MAG: hypothetical protein KDC85_01815 [Saprospiraceae bacterium]|nr:hypothetical protein [Saprospiraceae bacterium]MCB9323040.1 hypothetical protein [Lewinellaceae bacterium]